MKIIIFTEKNFSRYYSSYLKKKKAEVSCISNIFQDTLIEDGHSPFDLAVVDDCSQDAAKAYHYFNNIWSIPVVFIIDNKNQEWGGIRSLQPVGFIPKKAGVREFYARLMAIYRRLSMNNNSMEQEDANRPANSFHELKLCCFLPMAPQGALLQNAV